MLRPAGGRSSGRSVQAGTNSWASRWIPSHRPQRGSSPGIGTGRMISRTVPSRQKRWPRAAIQRRTWAGSPWNWNGPGFSAGRSDQLAGTSVATMSSRLIRQGVPSITSRQPSQRVATLSLTIVVIRTPMISIGPILAPHPESRAAWQEGLPGKARMTPSAFVMIHTGGHVNGSPDHKPALYRYPAFWMPGLVYFLLEAVLGVGIRGNGCGLPITVSELSLI